MKKLLSLPPNLVNCFHAIEYVNPEDWFCTSDPLDEPLGSGGGTAWLLNNCYEEEDPSFSFDEWLGSEKRILLHAGGQSRRLPGYAPSGKILTPIPVFRWARGQKLSQNLLSLQLPLYENILRKAPDSLHTLIASGDVYIRHNAPLQEIPQADVVCYGLWVDPSLATRHGVFVLERNRPDRLYSMLQKPSLERLGQLATSYFFLMDIGIWLLSDRAVKLLMDRSKTQPDEKFSFYDLYGEFGLALGDHPEVKDPELNQLSVAILPLPGGEFYHYGTTRELISSTLSVQNRVQDQRAIMHKRVKPHPAMFVQNSILEIPLSSQNGKLWIENSFIGKNWSLSARHVLTGIPLNDWNIHLKEGWCLDIIPVGEEGFVIRPYGFNDTFSGDPASSGTLFLENPFIEWVKERNIAIPSCQDIQFLPLFPYCTEKKEMHEVIQWMFSSSHSIEGKNIWERCETYSAADISEKANLFRLTSQRREFRNQNWPSMAENHGRSVFYQLDLADTAREFHANHLALPASLSGENLVLKRIHNHMFRSRILQLNGERYQEDQQAAFSLLRDALLDSISDKKVSPVLDVFRDQIVWGRSPVRIDLAGGWTDTPPYCLYSGGNVVNVAVELNGQPPLQVYIKPCEEYHIILRSIDRGVEKKIYTWEELEDYKRVGSAFSIPKAALSLAGFSPEFSLNRYDSLLSQLKDLDCGMEITLLAAIPAGSGLGTSSILAATVLATLSDFCRLGWDKNEIADRTLILEQLLTTGGGWQDQYGGIFHGLKLLQTEEGFSQRPLIRWLPEHLFTNPEYKECHLLYYTGITRTAKDILAEIVQGMFLNSRKHLEILDEMKLHALNMYEAIQCGNFNQYGEMILKTWEMNKALDRGTNPQPVEELIRLIAPYALGYKLPGAGGGGYLYMVAKDPEAAGKIKNILAGKSKSTNARFVDMNLSHKGVQVTRS